jgi:hypothetical protein
MNHQLIPHKKIKLAYTFLNLVNNAVYLSRYLLPLDASGSGCFCGDDFEDGIRWLEAACVYHDTVITSRYE